MSNAHSVDHYDAVIADLEAQIAQLEAAIATIKAVRSGNPVSTANVAKVDVTPRGGISPEIEIDTFHQLTLSQAIKKFLGMRPKKPATTQEIVEALKAGGKSGADGTNFAVVVNNSLNRMAAADGEVSKVKRGVWGLKAWYATNAKDVE